MKLSEHQIDACFEGATEQGEVIINLFRLVVPDFDEVEKMGYASCGEALWHHVCRKFFVFDAAHHPDCLPGGAWLNWGFSCDKTLKGWEVRPPKCITYKSAAAALKAVIA